LHIADPVLRDACGIPLRGAGNPAVHLTTGRQVDCVYGDVRATTERSRSIWAPSTGVDSHPRGAEYSSLHERHRRKTATLTLKSKPFDWHARCHLVRYSGERMPAGE
jgi:hypothetical protein